MFKIYFDSENIQLADTEPIHIVSILVTYVSLTGCMVLKMCILKESSIMLEFYNFHSLNMIFLIEKAHEISTTL